MTHDAEPVVGNWYRHADKGQGFSVIEVDEERLRVGLQYFDGDLDELDLDDWYELDVLPIDPPEDWTGPIDTLEPDELDVADSGGEVQGWEVPNDDDRKRTPPRRGAGQPGGGAGRTGVLKGRFRVSSFEFRVSSFEFRVSGFGFRVSGFELDRTRR